MHLSFSLFLLILFSVAKATDELSEYSVYSVEEDLIMEDDGILRDNLDSMVPWQPSRCGSLLVVGCFGC